MLLMTFVEISSSTASIVVLPQQHLPFPDHQDGYLLFTTENALPGNAPLPFKPGFGLQNLEKRLTCSMATGLS